MTQIQLVHDSLSGWLVHLPHLRVFLEPLISWLDGRNPPKLSHPSARPPAMSEDRMIDTLLLAVQNALAVCPPASDETVEERDNYIRDDSEFVCRLADKLELDTVTRNLQQIFVDLAGASDNEIQSSLARLLPFLEHYIWLANLHIDNHASWSKALLKLNHVLCSIALTVAKDGFCQPKESEEGAGDGEGQETVEGAGLGEGTGSENVSKDIQDESQVEGLQGDEAHNDEKVERAEEGNAIEMSEDFGGEMQDIPDAEDDGEEGSESGSDEEDGPEERQEDLDPSDENAIDEKLWGDEQGPDKQEESGKTDKDHSTEQTGTSEMVGKEGEEQRKEKEEKAQPDNPDSQAEEAAEQDMVDDQEAEEPNGPDGAPMDEHIQDANALDLPENLELEDTQDAAEQDLSGDMDDDLMDEDEDVEEQQGDADGNGGDDDDDMNDAMDTGEAQGMHEEDSNGQQAEPDMDTAVAEADTHAGDGSGTGEQSLPADATQSSAAEPQDGGDGAAGPTGGQDGQVDESEKEERVEYVCVFASSHHSILIIC